MIIYVENPHFPHRTFIVLIKPSDKVARIRAHLLHTLFELGKEDHQFKLRYKGQYLRDAYYVEDYDISENAVVRMIPMAKNNDVFADVKSLTSTATLNLDQGLGQTEDVKGALYKEVKTFVNREKMLRNFDGLIYLHFITTCLTLLTTYWYSFPWTLALLLFGVIFRPHYHKNGGYVGNYTHFRFIFCIIFGLAGFGIVGASLYIGIKQWMSVVNHGCKNWEFVDDCSHKNVFTAIFYLFHAIIILASSVLCVLLFLNFRIEIGDYIVKFLVQERDIEMVIKSAKSGKLKEKRTAAYELACMAASGDDNKFRIVAEDGLNVLKTMALSSDDSTQEHAVEAIGELLTIPSILDNFVETDGVNTLTSLLHSENARIMQEAALALYTIVSESEDYKEVVVANHGLDDLTHAAYQGTIFCQRTIASIFLELVFTSEIRAQIATRNIPAQAMVHLCNSTDPDTQRYALQTLELLAIESSDMICAQEELMEILIDIPNRTLDEKLYLLAGKILLYYAENRQTCETLVKSGGIRECLNMFARAQDAILQKVVVKIIFCMLETKEMKMEARRQGLDQVLRNLRDAATDRDVWDMADQGVQAIASDDDLPNLPTLSTLEKLNKMGKDQFGSRVSVSSDEKKVL